MKSVKADPNMMIAEKDVPVISVQTAVLLSVNPHFWFPLYIAAGEPDTNPTPLDHNLSQAPHQSH